jgi:Zn finger protein HypA/HybF involved in hydrogenase expression
MDASLAKILDGLDTRLALGEIDLATYNSLKAKFQAQAQGSAAGGDPLGGVVDGIRQEAAALKCPGCMAPLPPPADPSATTVTCEYCNGTFVIQKAEAEMEKLRGDVRKWISEVAGKGGGGSGDAASRSYIFRNSIFPGLKTAVERATELYQPIRYLPVFSFPLIDRLDRSPFKEALGLTPESRQLSESLKGIVSQVQAPELQPFAAGGRERADLKLLEVGCMELVHLSNVRHGLSSYSVDGFQRIVANTKALKEMYGGSADLLKSDDPAIAAFMSALVQRLDAVETAAETLESLLKSSDGVAVDPLVQRLDQAVIKCEAAASAFEASGREPKDTVPAAEGARNDATSIRILSASVKLFGDSVAAESGVPFADFLASLAQTIDAAAQIGRASCRERV